MQKQNAKAGDYVEVHLTKIIYEGILLESAETGIILLKLDTGYNIGFNKKDVLEIKVLKKEEVKKEKVEIKKDKDKPNIAMIITGGTIAARYDPKTGAASPVDDSTSLLNLYPELFKIVNVSKVEIPFRKDSGEMEPSDWKKIAKAAEKLLNDPEIKGLIITQGTDTLHYTAAALSFFLKDLNKPVVLTYSQRSIDRASSDAHLNLQCAALAAISDIAEVMLVGHASSNDDFCYAIPGTKVRKLHSSKRDAFKPVNTKPFVKIFPDQIQRISNYHLRNKGKVILDSKFENKVALIKYYPGQDPSILDYYLKEGYKGIVIEMFGFGQIAAKDAKNNWIPKLKEIQEKGIIVCAAAQTIYGRLDPLVYSTGRELLATGIIYLEDMLSDTAFVKLGYVLAKTKNKEEVKKLMLTNIAGELNDRLEE